MLQIMTSTEMEWIYNFLYMLVQLSVVDFQSGIISNPYDKFDDNHQDTVISSLALRLIFQFLRRIFIYLNPA